MRPISKATAHELRKDPTWADLDEVCDTCSVHGVDHLAEPNRGRELIGEQTPPGFGRFRVHIGARIRVDVDVDVARTPFHGAEIVVERLTPVRDDARMERRSDGKTNRRQPRRLQLRSNGIDRLYRTREYYFARCVVIGDHHARVLADQPRYGGRIGGNGDHRARPVRSGGRHQFASLACGHEKVGLGEASGRRERRQLTEAVARDRIRLQAQRPQQTQVSETHRSDRRLRGRHLGDLLRLCGSLFVVERRWWEHRTVQAGSSKFFQVGCAVPYLTGGVERHRGRRSHTDVLASLSRKHERDLAYGGVTESEDDVRIPEGIGRSVGDRGLGLLRTDGELFEVARYQRDAHPALRTESLRRKVGDAS